MAIYENINLEKGMYQSGRSLTEILEEMDPSENYKGTALLKVWHDHTFSFQSILVSVLNQIK